MKPQLVPWRKLKRNLHFDVPTESNPRVQFKSLWRTFYEMKSNSLNFPLARSFSIIRFFSSSPSSLVKLLNHLLYSALWCSWCNNSQKKKWKEEKIIIQATSKIVAVYLLQTLLDSQDSRLEFDSAMSSSSLKLQIKWTKTRISLSSLDQVIKVCWTTMTANRH